MAYKITLADARNSDLADVAATCKTTARFVSLVNQAQRRLLKRGNWVGTEVLVQFCLTDNCITWPRYVGTVLGVKPCGGSDLSIKNHWYNFRETHPNTWRNCGSFLTMVDHGFAPIYNEINTVGGAFVRYYVDKAADNGKTITLFGRDANGQELMEQVSGFWQNGLTLTATAPFVESAIRITKITSVTRQATEGMGRLFARDPDTNLLRDLGIYEPNETNPQYRRSKITSYQSVSGCRDSNKREYKPVEALVKLEFIPLVNERDFLLIDDLDALKFAIQAVRFEGSNDWINAEAFIRKAVRELKFDQRNKYPDESIPVRVVDGAGGYPHIL